MTCLAAHRLLVPLLEVDGDLLEGDDSDPCAGSDRAVAAVSMRDPDGAPRAGVHGDGAAGRVGRLGASPARGGPRAAGAILAEGGRALLVDAGSPHALRIEGVALARLASGEPWPDPWADPAVREAVIGELGPVLASGEVQVRLADPGAVGRAQSGGDQWRTSTGLVLEVRFPGGLPADRAEQRAAVIATPMSQSAALREVFDGVLAVTLVP